MRKSLFASAALVAVFSAASVSADEQKFELKPSGSGDEIEGTVTQVGKTLVHVSRISGKEYYDAVISIDKVSAVRMRVREK